MFDARTFMTKECIVEARFILTYVSRELINNWSIKEIRSSSSKGLKYAIKFNSLNPIDSSGMHLSRTAR